jgi:hypothetical protein
MAKSDELRDIERAMALHGYGAISRADGYGSIAKGGSHVKSRPAPPAPIVTRADTRMPPDSRKPPSERE